MATYQGFDIFLTDLFSAVHDLDATGDTLKVYLSNTTPLSTDELKSEVAEITAGNGYTSGGEDVQNSIANVSGVLTLSGVDVVWTASGGTIGPFHYVILYNDTTTAKVDPLIAWWDNGASDTLDDGESLTVDFGPTTGEIIVAQFT